MKFRRKNNYSVGLLAVVVFLASFAGAKEEAPPSSPAVNSRLLENSNQKVPVELEWEEIPGAKHYELEFQDLTGKVLNTFKSSSNVFKFRFKVGKYIVRSRVADGRGVFGDWSATTEFAIQPKSVPVSKSTVATSGVIDPKTLTSEVTLTWGECPGATEFRVRAINEKKEVVIDEVVKDFSYKAALPAGVYDVEITAIGNGGIASEPVMLPKKVTIQTVRLPKPEIIFEEIPDPKNAEVKIQRLPQQGDAPLLRLRPNSLSATAGVLEYSYFFSDEWVKVADINTKESKEIVLEQARKPGKYRITLWAEAKGLNKSEAIQHDFVVKPTAY